MKSATPTTLKELGELLLKHQGSYDHFNSFVAENTKTKIMISDEGKLELTGDTLQYISIFAHSEELKLKLDDYQIKEIHSICKLCDEKFNTYRDHQTDNLPLILHMFDEFKKTIFDIHQ